MSTTGLNPIPGPGLVTILVASDDGRKYAIQTVPRAMLEDEEAAAWCIKEALHRCDEKLAELEGG